MFVSDSSVRLSLFVSPHNSDTGSAVNKLSQPS